MSGDRQARRDIAEVLETLGTDHGDSVADLSGPARYRLEPTPMTVVACLACRHLGLIPSIPKVPRLVWECPGCGRGWALEPPPRIWLTGSAPTRTDGRKN